MIKPLLHAVASVSGTVIFWSVAWAGVMNFFWELSIVQGSPFNAHFPAQFISTTSHITAGQFAECSE